MADRQKTSQVIAEVATLNTGKQKTSQVVAEVATLNAGKQKVSQVIVEVAYTQTGLKELDLCEYSSDSAAQAAYVSSAGGNAVPQMTSNTTPEGVASCSDHIDVRDAWRAFDKSNSNDEADCWHSTSSAYPHWVQYQFTSAKTIARYVVASRPNGQHITSWILKGSNNGTDWTDLDTQTGADPANGTGTSYSIASPDSYSYYRLHCTAGNFSNYAIVGELGLYTAEYLKSYSESSTTKQGAYAIKVVALETDSLNQTLTKTLASAVDLSGYDAITFWLRASRTGENIKFTFKDASGGTVAEVTPDITSADTWQKVAINLTGVADADKDAISQIIVTVVDADEANTFYLDKIVGELEYGFESEKVTYYAQLTLDGYLAESYDETVGIDAILISSITKEVELDSYIKKTGIIKTTSLQAYIAKLNILKTLGIDGYLSKQEIINFDIDAFINKLNILKTLGIDAYLQSPGLISTSIDSYIQKQNIIKYLGLDAYLSKEVLLTLDLSALIKKANIPQTVNIDSYLSKVINLLVDFDSCLQKTEYKTLSLDADLIKTIIKTLSFDSYLQKTIVNTLVEFDVYLKKEGIEKSVDLEAILIRAIFFSIDAILANEDGVILYANMDAWIKKQGAEISSSLDAYLSKEGAGIISANIEGYLKKLAETITASVDSYLQKSNLSKTISIDSYISKNVLKTVSLDGFVLRGIPPNSVILDAYLIKSRPGITASMDAYLMAPSSSTNLFLVF